VSSPHGHTISQSALLTVFSLLPNRELEISGPVGQAYLFESRSTLGFGEGWNIFTNLVLPSSPFLLNDPGSANYPQQFYRATPLP
jgi:hypothetical protein